MIQRRRKQIYSVDAKLYLCEDAYDSLLREVEEILEEEKVEFECMPEGIQDGDRGAESRDAQSHLQRAIKVLPDYDSFEETVEECWKEIHPEIELNFVDWDCYSKEVPDDLDIFVFDTTSLDAFAQKGYLLALSEEDIQDYDDLIPSFMEGCRVNGVIYVVPQILCTDLLYIRKEDESLKDVHNVNELYAALGNSGLLLDKESPIIQIAMYLQALVDGTQHYTSSE